MNIIEGEVLSSVISGSGGKGGGGHTPVEATDTLKSVQQVKLLFAVSEGEITSIDDILLNKVSIANYSATHDFRSGTASQTTIPGFIDTEAPLSISPVVIKNSSTEYNNTVYVTGTANTTQQYTVLVPGAEYPVGTFAYTLNGTVDAVRITFTLSSLKKYQDNGDLVGYSVDFSIYTKYDPSATYALSKNTTKTGKASSTYSWDVVVNRPENTASTGSWLVAIKRNTIDDNTAKIVSVTSISAVTQLYYKQLNYPGTALVSLIINDASQFGGQTPTVLIKGKGRKVLIPNNYDPTTATSTSAGTYTGNWDLGFNPVKQFTKNVAWVIYDILHDDICLGIDSSDIDRVSFYNLSQYSDVLISDGLGGMIPRYSVGNQFFSRENVPTFLQSLLSLCNASLTTNEFGQIQIVYDQAGIQPSRLVTNANVIGGIFNYSSNDLENRYSLANVTYNNFKSYSETDTATHQDTGLINRYGLQPIDIVLPGCIYEAQAIRKARWAVYTNAITTNVLTFNVGFEGLAYKIGSVVKVMDSDNANVNQHGIITATSVVTGTTTLVLDRSITLANQAYTISFYATDGITLYTKTILQTNTTVNSVTFTGTEIPLIGSNFILSGTIVPQLYRITGITKNDTDYTIAAIVQDENKYAYIDGSVTVANPSKDFVNLTNFTVDPITNLQATPNSFTDGVNKNIQLHVTWDWSLASTASYHAQYEASWKRDSQDTVYVKEIEGKSFDINRLVPGTYSINVWAINPITSIRSAVTTITYNYRTNAGTSTLLPPVNARVTGTAGLSYNTPALSLSFDYNTANNLVSDSLLDYLVELWDSSGTTKYLSISVPHDIAFNGLFNLPLMQNIAAFGTATRSFQVKIYSRDLTGFISTALSVNVTNAAPAPQSFNVIPGLSSVFVNITTTPELDVTGYQVYRSVTSDFTPGVTADALTPIYDGPDTYITLNVPDTNTWYYKVAAYDSFGKTGLNYSSQKASTALSSDAIRWTLSGITFSIGTTNQLVWTGGTITRAGSTTYTIVSGTKTWTTGMVYVYFDPSVSTTVLQTTTTLAVAVGIGCFPICTYDGGDKTHIKGGDGSAFVSGSQLIAGTVGASQIIAGSIVASLLDTTNAVITGTAQIGTGVITSAHIVDGTITNAKIGDVIQSTVYTTTGTSRTGWKLDKAGTLTTYGGINIYDASGNPVMTTGPVPSFDYAYVGGTSAPQANATRNIYQGSYSGTFAYSVGDIVLDTNGDAWIAKVANTGVTPVAGATWGLYVAKGMDALTVQLSNEFQGLPANSAGTVSSYTGSGTTISVYEGTTKLTFDNVGTANGKYRITATPSGISVGTLPTTADANGDAVIPDANTMTAANTATITFNIIGKSKNGIAITAKAVQTLSKIKAGVDGFTAAIFSIDQSAATFNKNAAGVISPTTLTLTTTALNITAITGYVWSKSTDGGTTFTTIAGQTTSSLPIPNTDYTSQTTIKYKCVVTGTINGTTGQTLNDSITIPLLVDGVSVPTVVCSNENITFPAPLSGVATVYTGGSSVITAFIGSNQLSYSATAIASSFSCTIGTPVGATVGAGTGTGTTFTVPQPSAIGASTDSGYVDISVIVRDASNTALPAITKRINYSLSRTGSTGAQGPSVSITTTRAPIFTSQDNVLTASQTSITFNAITSGIISPTYAWTFYADSSATPITLSGVTTNANSCVIAQSDFDATGISRKSLKVVCIVSGNSNYTDHVTINKIDNSTAAPGATVGASFGTAVQLAYTVTGGTYTPTGGSVIGGTLFKSSALNNWVSCYFVSTTTIGVSNNIIFKAAATNKQLRIGLNTLGSSKINDIKNGIELGSDGKVYVASYPTITYTSPTSTTGTVGTITAVATTTWTGVITGLQAGKAATFTVGQPITATVGTGKLYGGTPTSCIVYAIDTVANTITFIVDGASATIPIAGTITNLTGSQPVTLTAKGKYAVNDTFEIFYNDSKGFIDFYRNGKLLQSNNIGTTGASMYIVGNFYTAGGSVVEKGSTQNNNLVGQITPSNIGMNIANLAVNTMQIAGNAVIVPIGKNVKKDIKVVPTLLQSGITAVNLQNNSVTGNMYYTVLDSFYIDLTVGSAKNQLTAQIVIDQVPAAFAANSYQNGSGSWVASGYGDFTGNGTNHFCGCIGFALIDASTNTEFYRFADSLRSYGDNRYDLATFNLIKKSLVYLGSVPYQSKGTLSICALWFSNNTVPEAVKYSQDMFQLKMQYLITGSKSGN